SWWAKQGWLTGNPLRRIRSRPVPADRTRAEVEELLGRDGVALRERVLWRLLYESAVRAGEVLAPDGRGRLSYRRAQELFVAASGGATLHQLRHSALTHAAEEGAQVPMLMAFSGHTSVSSVAKYARISPDRLSAWQDGRDPAARRGAR